MVAVVPGPNLGDDEHIGPVHPGVLDGLRHEGLGAVPLGGVDQAVPALPDGVHHSLMIVPPVMACSWDIAKNSRLYISYITRNEI